MFGRWRGLATPGAAAVDAACLGFFFLFSEYITCTVVLSTTLEVEKHKVTPVEQTAKWYQVPLGAENTSPRLEGVAYLRFRPLGDHLACVLNLALKLDRSV